jgi:hypothetical protein
MVVRGGFQFSLHPPVYRIAAPFLTIALLQKELSMIANLIATNDRDSRTDSVNDAQDPSLEILPLTIDQLSWVGGGEGQVTIG